MDFINHLLLQPHGQKGASTEPTNCSDHPSPVVLSAGQVRRTSDLPERTATRAGEGPSGWYFKANPPSVLSPKEHLSTSSAARDQVPLMKLPINPHPPTWTTLEPSLPSDHHHSLCTRDSHSTRMMGTHGTSIHGKNHHQIRADGS